MARNPRDIEKRAEQLQGAVFDALCEELKNGIRTECEKLREKADDAPSQESKDALRKAADEIENGASKSWDPLAKAIGSGVVAFLMGVADDQTSRGLACISDASTDPAFWTWFADLAKALTDWAKKQGGSLEDLRQALLSAVSGDGTASGVDRAVPTTLTGELR